MANFLKNDKGFTQHLFGEKDAGFTLLELLVSIGIFAVVMTAASGIFGTALQNQERMLTQQLAISNTSYTLEYISRAARMAKKDVDGKCLETKGCNYGNPDGGDTLRFLTHDKKCVEFFWDDNNSENNGQIKRRKSSDASNDNLPPKNEAPAFTSEDLNIKTLRFELWGECQGNQQQSTVTILLGAKTGKGASFQTQTSVTQRNLNAPK